MPASARPVAAGPSTNAELASIAMTPARSTDGSNRVSIMNQPISPSVADHRHHGRIRRKHGDAAASTNATFSPETAVRCDRPEVRNAVTIDSGSRASSPMTRPVNRAASGAADRRLGDTAQRRANTRRGAVERRPVAPVADHIEVELSDDVPDLGAPNVRRQQPSRRPARTPTRRPADRPDGDAASRTPRRRSALLRFRS